MKALGQDHGGGNWQTLDVNPDLPYSELYALPETGLPASLPTSLYSLAGAVNEFPGPKEGLALWWSQGAFGSQNCHEVLRKERIPVCSPQKERAGAKAPLGHRPSRLVPLPGFPAPYGRRVRTVATSPSCSW